MITKYRGLSISDNNKGQWVYGNLIVDGNYAYIVNGVIECNDQYITIAEWCPVDHKTIGAFTGLVDVNGKEIFEWDVVSFSIDNGWDYVASENGLIIYWDGCYQILGKGIKYRINQCLEEDIEVIGNMYENS